MSDYRKESVKFSSRNIKFLFANLFLACLVFGTSASFSPAQTDGEKPKPSTVTPEMLSASFAEVSKRVESAVVNIDTKGKVPAEITLKGEKPGATNPNDVMELYRRMLPRRPSTAVGSGFIVDKSGYILTNAHVIDDASRIIVSLQSGEEFTAKVIGTDVETDLAVLKIETGRDLPFIKFADSDAARIGDWVLAIGSPFGLAQTVTAGIISQTKRETPYARSFKNSFKPTRRLIAAIPADRSLI
jgi:serine protease Do